MFVYIGNPDTGKLYQTTRNLSFAPEVDVTGLSASIDRFEIDIQTTDKISIGSPATLDYNGITYSYFTITEVERPKCAKLVAVFTAPPPVLKSNFSISSFAP